MRKYCHHRISILIILFLCIVLQCGYSQSTQQAEFSIDNKIIWGMSVKDFTDAYGAEKIDSIGKVRGFDYVSDYEGEISKFTGEKRFDFYDNQLVFAEYHIFEISNFNDYKELLSAYTYKYGEEASTDFEEFKSVLVKLDENFDTSVIEKNLTEDSIHKFTCGQTNIWITYGYGVMVFYASPDFMSPEIPDTSEEREKNNSGHPNTNTTGI